MSVKSEEIEAEKADEATTEAKLESSIYHYFQWKVKKLVKQQQEDQEGSNENNDALSSDPSPSDSNNDDNINSIEKNIEKYNKVIDALKELDVVNEDEGVAFSLEEVPGVLIGFYTFLKAHESDVVLQDDDMNVDGNDTTSIDEDRKRKAPSDGKEEDSSQANADGQPPKKKTKSSKLKQLRAQIERQNSVIFAEQKKYETVNNKVAKLMNRYEKKDEVIAQLKEKLQKLKAKVKEEKTKTTSTTETGMSKRDAQWERRFQKLSDFITKHGPDQLKLLHTQNPGLSDWITTQRQCYFNKLPILTQERIDRLNAIGFTWTSATNHTVPFETRIKQCLEFKERYGHLTIPFLTEELNADGTEPTEEEKNFRLWAHKIRVKYKKRMVDGKKGALNPLMLRALDDIGFDWRVQDVTQENRSATSDRFIDRVEQLRKVAETYGSCNDKKNIVAMYPNNRSLLTWIQVTRRQYHKWSRGEPSTLTEERRKMLEDIGFDFNPRRHYAPPKTTRYKNFKTMRLKDADGVYVEVPDKKEAKAPVTTMPTQRLENPIIPNEAYLQVPIVATAVNMDEIDMSNVTNSFFA